MSIGTSVIREVRVRKGVGVRQLARQLNVSPSTVASWEQSESRGTAQIDTIQRAIGAMGEQLLLTTRRNDPAPPGPLRREDRVALELHRVIAQKLLDDPDRVRAAIGPGVEKRRPRVHGALAHAWLDEWARLASPAELGRLVETLVGLTRDAIDMRQVSPFFGVLDETERLAAIRRARAT